MSRSAGAWSTTLHQSRWKYSPAAGRIFQSPASSRSSSRVGNDNSQARYSGLTRSSAGLSKTVAEMRVTLIGAVPRGGDDTTAAADADNPRRPHQPGNPLLANGPTFGTQLGMKSRGTIGAARDSMDRAHSSEQRIISDGACRREARTPGIVAGCRHAEHACHRGDGEEGLVRAHELEEPDGITAVSRANQAAAFAKASRSWRSRRFSRRRRVSSSRSALVAPS